MKNKGIPAQEWAKIEQQMRIERSLAFYKLLNLPTIMFKKLKLATKTSIQNSQVIRPTNA